jgi:hypothetical protein
VKVVLEKSAHRQSAHRQSSLPARDRNAQIVQKLFKGRTHVVRLRLYYPGQSGKTSLTYF